MMEICLGFWSLVLFVIGFLVGGYFLKWRLEKSGYYFEWDDKVEIWRLKE